MIHGTEQKQNVNGGTSGGAAENDFLPKSAKSLVPKAGLEPARLAAGDFESHRFCAFSKPYRKSFPQTLRERSVNGGTPIKRNRNNPEKGNVMTDRPILFSAPMIRVFMRRKNPSKTAENAPTRKDFL